MSKHVRWLYGELPRLIKDGVIPESCASALRGHYGKVKTRSGSMVAVTICSVLGTLLIGAGIILLLGHNWNDLSRFVRTILAIAPLLVAQAGGVWCLAKNRESTAWRESISTLIMLMIGSSIALIGQTYHIPGNLTQFLFVWMVLSLPLMYLFRSVLPCLIYLAGITGWMGSSQYDGGNSILFWMLYAGVIPYVWRHLQKNRFSVPSSILGWGICIQALWIGLTLERVMPGLWIVVYMGLFAVLYLAGAYWFDDAPSGWQKPLQVVGAGGIVVMALMLTYEWPWDEVGWRHWHYGYRYHVHASWVDYLLATLMPIAGIALMVTAVRRKEMWRLAYGVSPLVAIVGFAIAASLSSLEFVPVLICNIYAFLLGLVTLIYGIKNGRLSAVNGGMGILSTLIVMRFFDEDFSLIVKGVTFIILGTGFLVTNLVILRKKRNEGELS